MTTWGDGPKISLNQLQVSQNNTVRALCRAPLRNPTQNLLRSTHLLRVKNIYNYMTVKNVLKALIGLTQPDWFSPYHSVY